ncbi:MULTISPECIES: HK97-gp10 family putative phage morphogenesis protein [Chelativorans]|jgi:HK97 gp10 family phage protein|uniref:Phage protein, HK97 gp10 family n=1 Tax=Chelativorans sp. (strain BNC1) TaxID=266779 RepID=Q11H44_CHESB|nr:MULTISPECIES: HK97-gp10 family putative phage morphogenesis protein [Chelativorans]
MAKSAQLARLQQRLDAIPKAVKKAVEPALKKSGDEMAASMRHLAPVDTGELRDSIEVTAPGQSTPRYSQPGGSREAAENEVLITAGNSDVRYAHLVEYGTADTEAQPFFWPAFRLNRKRATNRIKRAISKAVKENWGK